MPHPSKSAWFGAVAEEMDGDVDVIDDELSGMEASFGRQIALVDDPVVSVDMDALANCFKWDIVQDVQAVVLETIGVDQSSIPDWVSNAVTGGIEVMPGFMILALFNPLEATTEEPRDIAKALVRTPEFANWPNLDHEAKIVLLEDVLINQIGTMDQTISVMQQALASDSWTEALKAGPQAVLAFFEDVYENVKAGVIPGADEQNFNKLAYVYVVWHLMGEAVRAGADLVEWDARSFSEMFDKYPELISEIDAVVASGFAVMTLEGSVPEPAVVPMAPPDLFPIEEVAPASAAGFARPATVLGVGYAAIGVGAMLKVF